MKKRKTSNSADAQNHLGDFGGAISALCEEKGISKEKVIETIEAALAAAYKKDYGKRGQNIKAVFDQVSGGAKFFLVKEVVDETLREFVTEEELKERLARNASRSDASGAEKREIEKGEMGGRGEKGEKGAGSAEATADETEKLPRYNMERDLTLDEAKKIDKKAKVGDIIEIELEEKKDYGRVAAQTAKQVIIQRIREAERDSMFEEYKDKEGEIVSGVVQRIEGMNVFIDIGKSVGVLFPSEQIERENYRIGQRLKIYIQKVEAGSRGPGISLSRVHPQIIQKLFELEVPEIFSGTVQIKSIAREAGERTKIAVASSEDGIDPIGSCVGQKGTRVQSVIDELGGEKIDIILWNEDIAKFIAASLSPAKVLKVDIKEETAEATVSVPEDQLSLAIGKRGQNVRLAAKLTGWKIDIIGVKNDGEEVKPEENAVEGEEVTEEKKTEEAKPAKKKKAKKADAEAEKAEEAEEAEEAKSEE